MVAVAVGTRAVRPGHRVKLRLAGLTAGHDRRPLEFEVVEAHPWFDQDEGGDAHAQELEDICLLRIAEGEELPPSAQTVKSDMQQVEDLEGLTVRGKGLRSYRGKDPAKLFDADIAGKVGLVDKKRWMVKAKDRENAPRRGSSGAGLFYADKGLIGMVLTTQGELSGTIVPIDVLHKVYPIAPVPSRESPVLESRQRSSSGPLQRTWTRAIYKLDRSPQIGDFADLYRSRWDSRKEGFVCLVGGLPEDLPYDCAERFCTEYWEWTFKSRHEKQRPPPKDLDWPKRIGMKGRRHYLRRLQNALVKGLKADGSDPAQIRLAMDRLNKPVIFYSWIDQERINSEQHELLREWVEFFAEINSEPLGQTLIHVLLLRFDPTGPYANSTDDGAEFLEGLCERASVDDECLLHPIEVLDELETDDLRNWIATTGHELARSEEETRDMEIAAASHFGETGEFRYKNAKEWITTYDEGRHASRG